MFMPLGRRRVAGKYEQREGQQILGHVVFQWLSLFAEERAILEPK
jgi:hypothetical protein